MSITHWFNHERLKQESSVYWDARELYTKIRIWSQMLGDRPVRHKKKRILFYHVSGLSFAGTETFLQLIAKYLPKETYDVYFAYADQKKSGMGVTDMTSRLASIVAGGVFPIRFEYDHIESRLPYTIKGMSPHITTIIRDFAIDVLVTAGAGHAEFPFSGITSIPIILINIFGQPNRQKNITHQVCISQEVAKKIAPFVPEEKIKVMYIPSELPPPETAMWGKELRYSFGIADNALVLGRVGRASDDIFDPIGLLAFAKVAHQFPDVHYLVVAPPPRAISLVNELQIPRVHFHPGSGATKEMWSFYGAMDVLAHFRRDGESFGLNIAQAMLAGKPILSHRSPIWNAHAEYLTPDFSRIAAQDNVDEYAENITWIVGEWRAGNVPSIGEKARLAGEQLVFIERHIDRFESYIKEALNMRNY